MTLAVCMPSKTAPEFQTTVSLESLSLASGTHRFRVTEKSIDVARNMLTKVALSHDDVTHLLFIDDDMVFRPESAARLIDHHVPIVGGLCFNRREPYQPVLARLQPPEYALENRYGWIYDYPKNALVSVDGTGAAFLLVARDVLEAVGGTYGEEHWWDKLPETSEDFSFCWRVRECGYEILVDTGLEIGHIGKVCVDAAFAERNRKFFVGTWHTPFTARTEGVQRGKGEEEEDVKPRASIVIPAFNPEGRLLQAAVASAVMQTVPVEVIVVDDGSAEDIASVTLSRDTAIGKSPNLRVIRHETNRGIAAALNTGLKAMTTDWFCWLSSDDLLDAAKVEQQLHLMELARAKASFHQYNVVDSRTNATAGVSNPYSWINIPQQMSLLARACVINGSTVVIHKSVFEEVGYFEETMRYAQDWEMWCRVGERFLWLPIPEVLGTRREGQNLTEAISADDARAAIRDDEGVDVMERYARWAR
jgi:teichuronic acid biosynthesis glycosyltransferase TuaG